MRSTSWIARSAVVSLMLAAPVAALEPNAALTVTRLLETTTSWDGKPLHYPSGEAKLTALVIDIAPGGETGWHEHPVPSFGFVLDGTLEVRLEDGRVKRIGKGEALAEVVGTMHNGRNVDKVPLKLVVFYAGAPGIPLTLGPNTNAKP